MRRGAAAAAATAAGVVVDRVSSRQSSWCRSRAAKQQAGAGAAAEREKEAEDDTYRDDGVFHLKKHTHSLPTSSLTFSVQPPSFALNLTYLPPPSSFVSPFPIHSHSFPIHSFSPSASRQNRPYHFVLFPPDPHPPATLVCCPCNSPQSPLSYSSLQPLNVPTCLPVAPLLACLLACFIRRRRCRLSPLFSSRRPTYLLAPHPYSLTHSNNSLQPKRPRRSPFFQSKAPATSRPTASPFRHSVYSAAAVLHGFNPILTPTLLVIFPRPVRLSSPAPTNPNPLSCASYTP